MTCESGERMWGWWKPLAVAPVAVLVAGVLLAGCGLRGGTPEAVQPGDVVCPETGTYDADAIHALIAYHREIRDLDRTELERAQRAVGDAGDRPLEQMRQAILLGDPRSAGELPRALALLEAVLASRRDDAVAVRSLARMLSNEMQEQMRLRRQLDRAGAQLKTSEQARAELQEKLDALAEIERSLPTRPSPEPVVPPKPAERRSAQ
ncbi:MAG TPA: hypothetical protein PK725_10305 [Rhodocyclaceae bacterium]|nr:hypothetical protein [Rhodocyclaceae bacterium]HRQ47332.1 hypothetical protein [Rhodocyclaceae bacterium]